MSRQTFSTTLLAVLLLWSAAGAEGQHEPEWPVPAELVYNGDGLATIRFHDESGSLIERRELLPEEAELIHSARGLATVRFQDRGGRLVERALFADGKTSDHYFDGSGRLVKHVVRYSDGRVDVDDLLYGHPQDEVRPEGAHIMSPGEDAFATGRNLTQQEFDDFLARLPPPPQSPYAFLDSEHPWGYDRREGARTDFRLLHQEMAVESARIGERWLRITDSRGGVRHDYYTKNIEEGGRHVGSFDALGRIAHVVTNDEGYLAQVWYGENLVASYHYVPVEAEGLAAFWFELVDARTGRQLLDSRSLSIAAAQPRFSALGGAVESVDDEIFAVVNHDLRDHGVRGGERYALLPLHEGPVWRTVLVAGTEEHELRSRVHYTDDRLKVEFLLNSYFNGNFYPDLVVEAPRRGSSPIKVTWPQDITLPLVGKARPPR